MAQDYDVVLKLLFRSNSSRAVQRIAGSPVSRWLDTELPSIRNTRADLIGESSDGETRSSGVYERKPEALRASNGRLLC